ncbi:MAG: HAMP domain-containing sensor histidine kinase [Butyricicoccus sp.]|nr:HAMP domain-containing sensor histidine kinase [Butyricicoccus sp.]
MSYRDKLRLMIVLLLVLSVGLSGAWLITVSFDNALTREAGAAQDEQRMALSMLAAATSHPEWEERDLAGAIRILERQSGQSFRLSDEQGRVLYQQVYHGQTFQSGLIEQTNAQTMAWRVQQESNGSHMIQTAGMMTDGTQTFYLEGLRSIEDIYRARNALSRSFVGLLFAMAGLGILTAVLLSRWLTGSLTALAETARAITEGDLSRRADEQGQDEIGQLARDFNLMTNRLSKNIEALQGAVERQEEFMASFAHEMRTPMTSIIGYADLLRSTELPPESRAAAVHYIFSEGKRLESLSNKLLDLIVLQKQDIAKKPCDMGALIRQAGGLFEQRFQQAGITFSCEADNTVWMVEPDLFQTLVINLLDNARKAMPDGGQIHVQAGRMGQQWQMRVQDTGRGMPAEAIPRLTEAFYRVDKARARASGGVGLGLRLCAEIVKLHQGTLSFASQEGRGTTVTVCFREGAAK